MCVHGYEMSRPNATHEELASRPWLTQSLVRVQMPQPLMDGSIEYEDGTEATQSQMAKDVTIFLAWASEPEHDGAFTHTHTHTHTHTLVRSVCVCRGDLCVPACLSVIRAKMKVQLHLRDPLTRSVLRSGTSVYTTLCIGVLEKECCTLSRQLP